MIFQYKNTGYSINCDWLQFSVTLSSFEPEFLCPDGYRLEITQGNNIFEHRAILSDLNGEKILTLLWKPYSSVLDPLCMTVQVANRYLYGYNFGNVMDLVNQITPCHFNSMGRIDICCDFQINTPKLIMIKQLATGKQYVERKQEGANWWHQTQSDGYRHKQVHCLNWGSNKSEIKVKLYHKSRELGLVGGTEPEKPWIVEEWKRIGFDCQNVWRLEFSLSGAGQLRWNDELITLQNVASPSWLMRVFFDLYHTRFVTRRNAGMRKGHKNLDPQTHLLILPRNGEHLQWYESEEPAIESKPAVTLLRSMMRNIDNEYVMASKATYCSYVNSVIDLIRNAQLEKYFQHVFGSDSDTYFETLYQEVGGGIHNHIVKPNKFFD